jgi:hypothetical protein
MKKLTLIPFAIGVPVSLTPMVPLSCECLCKLSKKFEVKKKGLGGRYMKEKIS